MGHQRTAKIMQPKQVGKLEKPEQDSESIFPRIQKLP